MDKLDEQALRREDFKGGSPVVLADGNTWYFARPVVNFVEDETECGYETLVDLDGDDGGFSRLLKARDEAVAGKRFGDAIGIDIRVGAKLLLRNYDLTLGQRKALMPFSFDEGTESARIYSEVMAVAHGNGPKPEGGGTD